MPADFAVTEFWRVLSGAAPGRVSDAQITLFDSVGFALEDYSALRTMQALGRRRGCCRASSWCPRWQIPRIVCPAAPG
jgi:ornithine cyclodeaminase